MTYLVSKTGGFFGLEPSISLIEILSLINFGGVGGQISTVGNLYWGINGSMQRLVWNLTILGYAPLISLFVKLY